MRPARRIGAVLFYGLAVGGLAIGADWAVSKLLLNQLEELRTEPERAFEVMRSFELWAPWIITLWFTLVACAAIAPGFRSGVSLARRRALSLPTGRPLHLIAMVAASSWLGLLAAASANAFEVSMPSMLISPAGILLTCVVGPAVEELFFRGYLQRALSVTLRPLSSIFLASLCFAVAHGFVLNATSSLLLGLWCGVIAWRTGSTLMAMAAHMAANGAVVVVYAYCGDVVPTPAFLAKASLVVLPLMIAAILALRQTVTVQGMACRKALTAQGESA